MPSSGSTCQALPTLAHATSPPPLSSASMNLGPCLQSNPTTWIVPARPWQLPSASDAADRKTVEQSLLSAAEWCEEQACSANMDAPKAKAGGRRIHLTTAEPYERRGKHEREVERRSRGPACPGTYLSLAPLGPDNATVIKGGANVLASAAVAVLAGCSTQGATHPTASTVHVPNPAQVASFDLAAYNAHHADAASASRLLSGCLDHYSGSVVQVAVERSLSDLRIDGRGVGVGIVFQGGATTAQRHAVASCLQASGARLR